jgi:hypothetical protein
MPGMALQGLTTKEPDDSMVEVALISFLAAEGERSDEEIEQLIAAYSHVKEEEKAEGEKKEQAAGAQNEAEPC